MEEIFRLWSVLKGHDKHLLIFMVKDDVVLVNSDATTAALAADSMHEVMFTAQGSFWRFPSGLKGVVLRLLDMAGLKARCVYPSKCVDLVKKVRPEKIRKLGERVILEEDERTHRKKIGVSGMVTLWWDSHERMVYMRTPSGQWLGHFCAPQDWSRMTGRVQEFREIPEQEACLAN